MCDGRSKPTSHDRIVAQCFLSKLDIAEEMTKSGTVCDWPKFSGGRYKIGEATCLRKWDREPNSWPVHAAAKADEANVCNLYYADLRIMPTDDRKPSLMLAITANRSA